MPGQRELPELGRKPEIAAGKTDIAENGEAVLRRCAAPPRPDPVVFAGFCFAIPQFCLWPGSWVDVAPTRHRCACLLGDFLNDAGHGPDHHGQTARQASNRFRPASQEITDQYRLA